MPAGIFYSASNPNNEKLAYRCVAIDIDGTLINENKEIPLANKETLAEYSAAGGTVFLISGRLPASVRWHLELLGIDAPFVAMNGAFVGYGREMLWGRSFNQQTVLDFLKFCRQRSLYCHIYTDKAMLFDTPAVWNRHWTERNFAWLEGQPRKPERYWSDQDVTLAHPVGDLVQLITEENPAIYKMAIFSHLPLDAYWKELEKIPGLAVTSSDLSFNLEVTPAGVAKGEALAWLAGRFGIMPESIMAIGDNFNDISMFKAAGWSVAMGNAPETVRNMARQVTGANDAAGVAEAVARWAYAG